MSLSDCDFGVLGGESISDEDLDAVSSYTALTMLHWRR
jgi:hypothetical protein